MSVLVFGEYVPIKELLRLRRYFLLYEPNLRIRIGGGEDGKKLEEFLGGGEKEYTTSPVAGTEKWPESFVLYSLRQLLGGVQSETTLFWLRLLLNKNPELEVSLKHIGDEPKTGFVVKTPALEGQTDDSVVWLEAEQYHKLNELVKTINGFRQKPLSNTESEMEHSYCKLAKFLAKRHAAVKTKPVREEGKLHAVILMSTGLCKIQFAGDLKTHRFDFSHKQYYNCRLYDLLDFFFRNFVLEKHELTKTKPKISFINGAVDITRFQRLIRKEGIAEVYEYH